MLRVAKRVGWAAQGENGRELPTKVTTLDDLRQAVNDAVEWFWGGCGEERRKWRWLTRPLSIALATTATDPRSIAESTYHFMLGASIAGPALGKEGAYWTAGTSTGKATRVGVSILNAELAESPGRTGPPRMYALDMIDAPGAAAAGGTAWTLKVFPKPDESYTLFVPVRREFARFTDPKLAVPWPKVHDRLIVMRAVIEANANGSLSESMDIAAAQVELAGAVRASVFADNQIDGSYVGQFIDTEEAEGSGAYARRPTLADCTEFDGSPVG